MTAATPEACEEAMVIVHGALSIGPATSDDPRVAARLEEQFYQRISEQAAILAATGWTAAMVKATIPALATSPDLDEKIRYGRPIVAADFERIRRDGLREQRIRDESEDGLATERVITTRTGFALRVASARLYAFAEAKGLWQAAGEPGHFSDARRPDGTLAEYPDAMFTVAFVDGQPWWRLK